MSTWVTGTTVTENSTNPQTMTSNVTINLIVGWNGGSWAGDNPAYYINVNGSRVKSGTANFNTGEASSGSQTIATWTGNVPHNADGTGSMTWAVGYEGIYAGEGRYSTASGTKTLTTIIVDDSNRFLDKAGLTYFWSKLKSYFVAQVSGKGLSTNDFTTAEKTKLSGIESGAEVNVIESIALNGTAQTVTNKAVDLALVTSVNGQTGDVIVQGGGGGGDADNNLVTLWTNPNPTSAFNAQTITLSQSATDFDALLVYCRYNPTQNATNGISIASTSGITRLLAGQGTTGTAIGMRTMTVNGTSVTFTTGQYNGANSEGTNTQLCVPEKICGLKIKGIGESSQLELIWTNSAPTSAFTQQTVALDLTPYDAVVIECNTSSNTATGRTMQFGLIGSSVRLMAEIYQIHRRLATIASDGITFGNNYYLPTYANGSETEANTYLIPTRIYGLRGVKPKKGKTLLWTNPSPTSTFTAQTITLGQSAEQYDLLMVKCRYTNTEDSTFTTFIDASVTSRQTVMSARYVVNSTTTFVIRDATISTNQITFTTGRYLEPSGNGTGDRYCIPLEVYGVNFMDSGASTLPTEYVSNLTWTDWANTKTLTWTVHGSGYVYVTASTRASANNDTGTAYVEILLNGNLVAVDLNRLTSASTVRISASTSAMMNVSDGDTITINLSNTKGGTAEGYRRVMAFGCSLT